MRKISEIKVFGFINFHIDWKNLFAKQMIILEFKICFFQMFRIQERCDEWSGPKTFRSKDSSYVEEKAKVLKRCGVKSEAVFSVEVKNSNSFIYEILILRSQ